MIHDRSEYLMQGALDDALSPEEAQELETLLDEDPEKAEVFDAQQRVDNLLRYPPVERAPERLAMTIMARIAQAAKPQVQSAITDAQMQVAVQLVTVATLPLLVSAGYMLLNAQSDPEAIERVLEKVLALLLLVTDVIDVLIEQAEEVYDEDPEMAMAMLSMIPSALLLLVTEILENDDDASA